MNTEPLLIPAKKIKKTEDMTTYMREYMRNRYAEDPDSTRGRNKIYYYKNKSGLGPDKIKQYGDIFPYVAKLKISINELHTKDANIAISVLTEYLQDLLKKSGDI
jgi:hypothetical protein